MSNYSINLDECQKAGVDIDRIKSIARRIGKAAIEAEGLGIQLFGGCGRASLRFRDDHPSDTSLILAKIDGNWDGGAGDEKYDDEGLLRGE